MKDCSQDIVYQIYPKSYQDTTGNGLGDLQGIISRLDYLKELGITYIWLNPIYPSPQKDNGYDVADYTAINPDYGTMEDFEQLVKEADKRGIGIMLDMVFNHTSTEHEWFKKAIAGETKYKNYYIWKKSKDGKLPTNWPSKFGGPCWQYVEKYDEYYLHLFDPTQADLDLSNPEVRDELVNVLKFWISKGVRGFRFDVINLIDKMSYEDCHGTEGKEFYTDGPKVGAYLHEFYTRALAEADPMTVGEMSSTTLKKCAQYSNPDNEELTMCFNFHHLKVDYANKEKWTLMPFDFHELKSLLNEWDVEMEKEGGWNALFWNCHDQPRSISRFGDPVNYPKESGKMLAAVNFTRRGTPYIHYGEEIGMTNLNTQSISEYRDVESLNAAKMLAEKGLNQNEILEILHSKSRDNGRSPMQWNDKKNGGFSDHEPWLESNDNLASVNVEASIQDPDSIFHYYQKLIQLKKESEVLRYGTTKPELVDDDSLYAYRRILTKDNPHNSSNQEEEILCIHNFYPHNAKCDLDLNGYSRLLSNYEDFKPETHLLRPYESLILKKEN